MFVKNPDKIARHKEYIRCLKSTNIEVEIGRFKRRDIEVDGEIDKDTGEVSKIESFIHEEKETDVAIVSRLFECFCANKCDTVVIISGDTDLVPAVKTCKRLYPDKTIGFLFPYGRKNDDLGNLVTKSFVIGKEQYTNHQLPEPVILKNGKEINKPSEW